MPRLPDGWPFGYVLGLGNDCCVVSLLDQLPDGRLIVLWRATAIDETHARILAWDHHLGHPLSFPLDVWELRVYDPGVR